MMTLEDLKKEGWQAGINQVINADCLEGMKLIPDKSVDLVLTDPPYNASNGSLKETINEEWDKDFLAKPFLDESFRMLRDGGSLLAFCSYHTLNQYLSYPKKIQQILHWEYITALPAIAKVYTPTIEYIVWFSSPNYTFNKELSRRNVFKFLKPYQVNENFNHPSPKPLDLIIKLLSIHSNPDNLICDPFMGSWTTARACKDLGRNFIGFELEKKYCEIGEKRLQQQNLF